MINQLPEKEFFAKGHRACAGCGSVLALRHVLKAAGKNTIIAQATGCMEVVSTPYPQTAWKLPWIHVLFENAAAVASGIESALKKLNKKNINVLAIAGDGGTFDIGLQALSGAMERGHRFCYVCIDNEAYMNCLALDTLILTEDGLKKVTEVREGEKVYAFNQKTQNPVLKRCTGIFNNGRRKVYELGTLHHNIKATSNHPFLVLKRNGRGKQNTLVWKTLSKIKAGDEIVVLKNLNKDKSYVFKKIKLSKKGDYKVHKINPVNIPSLSSPELMEYLGLYVGDGWLRANRGEIGFALPEKSKARARLVKLHKKLFGQKLSSNDKFYIYANSVNIARFINSLGFGQGAKNKIIPKWIFTIPHKEKEAFVKGLMLSDGYRINNSFRYVSASFELLKRLRLLLQTMNYRVGKIHMQKKTKGTKCVYRKLLKDSTYGYICFSKRRKWNVAKYKNQYKYQNFLIENKFFETEKVKHVRLCSVEPTLDLRVEGEHNFLANGIVVHNTGIQRSGATPLFASTTTTPAGKLIPGKPQPKKQLPFIVAAHGIRYVATCSSASPVDIYNKVKNALSINGPSFVHIFTPCPPGWKYPSEQTIDIARIAIKTRVTPIYEIEDGVLKLNKVEDKKPVEEYLKLQGRFKHLTKEHIKQVQRYVDERYDFLLENDGKKLFDVLY